MDNSRTSQNNQPVQFMKQRFVFERSIRMRVTIKIAFKNYVYLFIVDTYKNV